MLWVIILLFVLMILCIAALFVAVHNDVRIEAIISFVVAIFGFLITIISLILLIV